VIGDAERGQRLPAMLSRLGLRDVAAMAETAHCDGGSAWAAYWARGVKRAVTG